ncbi:MAG: 30S ribosome-binding factor RbfA [Acidobacteria bacterium]|nr:30S ribosome-binding factor RbfA [Acidobacteriota bacterium]MBA3888061.1 30S ribosome-binding factor RbfA [Acidobacteriota bacterium]
MPGPSRQSRVGDQIRVELAELIARQVHDPGIGFLTITHVKMTPDLQQARVYYTTIGDDKARRDTAKALERATPFLRRLVGQRLRLRRVPELQFFFDESVEKQDRIERILLDLERERAEAPAPDEPPAARESNGAPSEDSKTPPGAGMAEDTHDE